MTTEHEVEAQDFFVVHFRRPLPRFRKKGLHECMVCFALVVNTRNHARWHAGRPMNPSIPEGQHIIATEYVQG